MKQIIVTFDNGQSTIETKGFTGGDCVKETLDLKKALGVVKSEKKTPEFFQTATAAQKARHGR